MGSRSIFYCIESVWAGEGPINGLFKHFRPLPAHHPFIHMFCGLFGVWGGRASGAIHSVLGRPEWAMDLDS